MNGAGSIIKTLLDAGVDCCFANPGTSEMHLVEAIDAEERFRAVLCLFEGVCTGAADGYARMNGLPATTLLHLGAGLANGVANLHNARRASSPLINLVGEHGIHHVAYDAPLTSDVEGVAKPMSAWVRTSRTSTALALDTRDALQASLAANPDHMGNVATMVIPVDCAWGEGRVVPGGKIEVQRVGVSKEVVSNIAASFGKKSLMLIDGSAMSEEGVMQAGRIAEKTGCQVMAVTFPARIESGPGLPAIGRLPYFPEQIIELMAGIDHLVLAGARSPVSFFAYQNLPSDMVPDTCKVQVLAEKHLDLVSALTDLADALGAPAQATKLNIQARPELVDGPLNAYTVAKTLGAKIPEMSIITTDSGGGAAAAPILQSCVRHSWLNLTGGSIGGGGPVAVGAAVACPDRPVFALLGDGGAGYTIQYLWTAAREKLNVTTIIYANKVYGILDVEYRRLGINDVGEKAASLFDLSNPTISWVSLAKGYGVPGVEVHTVAELAEALTTAENIEGPFLIEAKLS